MTKELNEAFQDRARLMSAQLAHLSDGRDYMLQRHNGTGWENLGPVHGTALCDNLTTWLLTNGAGRVRALG